MELGDTRREIKSAANKWTSSIRNSLRDEVILCRLRIGHTRLTHGFLMTREPPQNVYSLQNKPHSQVYQEERHKINQPHHMREIFSDSTKHFFSVFTFLKTLIYINRYKLNLNMANRGKLPQMRLKQIGDNRDPETLITNKNLYTCITKTKIKCKKYYFSNGKLLNVRQI